MSVNVSVTVQLAESELLSQSSHWSHLKVSVKVSVNGGRIGASPNRSVAEWERAGHGIRNGPSGRIRESFKVSESERVNQVVQRVRL